MDGWTSRGAYISYATAFTLAGLAYEAMVPIAAAGALMLMKERAWPSARRVTLLLLPVMTFSGLYAVHALRAARLNYVDRADGQALVESANIGSTVYGAGRVLATWGRELALPTALQLTSAPFERFGKSFTVSWDRLQLANLVIVALAVALLVSSTSRHHFRRVGRFVVLVLIGLIIYSVLIAFGRSADEVVAITYYSYVPAVLLVPLFYALVDFDRLSKWKLAAFTALLVAFAAVHATGTIAAIDEVRRVNRYQSLYLSRVIAFVDAHRAEPDFTFRIEPHPESLDPAILLLAGYPNDPAASRQERRMTEILFAPYYDGRDPKYVLSASAERIVHQRNDPTQ
jgi:hypothetical protein